MGVLSFVDFGVSCPFSFLVLGDTYGLKTFAGTVRLVVTSVLIQHASACAVHL